MSVREKYSFIRYFLIQKFSTKVTCFRTMLKLSSFFSKAKKGAGLLKATKKKARVEGKIGDVITSLSAAQLDQVRQAVATSDKQVDDDAQHVPRHLQKFRHKNKRMPFIHYKEGVPRIWQLKDPDIKFSEKGFPNYPGDPLPTLQANWRKEFQKRRMQKNYWEKETIFKVLKIFFLKKFENTTVKNFSMIQYAPMRRMLYNIAKNSQTILPKQMTNDANKEFLSISKGHAVRTGEHWSWNRFSTYKYANPRKTRNMCVMSGQIFGNLARYRMHRMMWRTFADANKISGVRVAAWGPRCSWTAALRPHSRYTKFAHTKHDDFPQYV